LGAANIDTIADFNVTDDLIQLAKSVMTALGAVGALTDAEFESGAGLAAAEDSTTRIFYNETTGALYYDADGSGATAAVQLATFTGEPELTLNNLFIV
jgi:Ca2+-binding RTX toxin-like protein